MVSKSVLESHAQALEKIGRDMDAAGIGGDRFRGHVVTLKMIAGNLRSGIDYFDPNVWSPPPPR
jgi:hypothetical protein